jgi:Zn-dependent peptidase ImmA (M78 family)
LRYKSDDHLWFSFFHEAAHLLLHGKRRIFIDDDTGKDGLDAEANVFAANFLIPPPAFKHLMKSTPVTEAAILRVAKEIGIAPGIIVGRLQHENILQFSECNHLKKRFEWANRTRRRAAA